VTAKPEPWESSQKKMRALEEGDRHDGLQPVATRLATDDADKIIFVFVQTDSEIVSDSFTENDFNRLENSSENPQP
jgi:hypothetical protein